LAPMMGTSASGYLGQTHSILWDLVLWCGIPLGVSLILLAIYVLTAIFRRIANMEQLIVYSMVVVILPHALLELPHHTLHFLLVPALALGALLAMQAQTLKDEPSRKWDSFFDTLWKPVPWSWLMFSLGWLLAAISAHFMIKDYFRAEASMWQLRLEDNKGLPLTEHEVPPMFALSQLQSMMELLPMRIHSRYSLQDLAWMEQAVDGETTPTGHFVLMANMALAGQTDRARYLMWTLSKSLPQQEARKFKQRWVALQQQHPKLSSLQWPETGQTASQRPVGGSSALKAPTPP
jgi:hypothetical protein